MIDNPPHSYQPLLKMQLMNILLCAMSLANHPISRWYLMLYRGIGSYIYTDFLDFA
nr:hypothetical protein [uncultured Moraxella sp.]